MAIIRLAQPFDAFHGTVAGQDAGSKLTLWSTNKIHAASRQWVSPTNPQSTGQMAMRAYQIAAAAAYSALTQAKAAAWIAAAEQINRENILGLSYTLSGINLFCMINAYRQIDGQAIISDVPTLQHAALCTSVDTVSKPNATTLAFIARVPGAAVGEMCMARISEPLPSANRKARKNDVRLHAPWTQCITVNSAGAVTFLLTITSTEYIVGDYLGIEITPLSTNYLPGTKILFGNKRVN